jgi:hypothetical protein
MSEVINSSRNKFVGENIGDIINSICVVIAYLFLRVTYYMMNLLQGAMIVNIAMLGSATVMVHCTLCLTLLY